jgi:hypothetical protein
MDKSELGLALATVSRFLIGKTVDYATFMEILRLLFFFEQYCEWEKCLVQTAQKGHLLIVPALQIYGMKG